MSDNWELPSEYRQYAEMIAVDPTGPLAVRLREAVREDDESRAAWERVRGDGLAKMSRIRAALFDKDRPVRGPFPESDPRFVEFLAGRSPTDDWAGFQPPRAIKSIGADPRSESIAKALRLT